MIRKGDPTQFVEKWVMRAAFDTPEEPYLPKEVLWRQKEQFSDGVGYDWIDGLKAHAEMMIAERGSLAAEGAVFRRGGLRLDRRAQGPRRDDDFRKRFSGGRRSSFPTGWATIGST